MSASSGSRSRPATAAPEKEEDADQRKRWKLNEKVKPGAEERTRKKRSTALLDLYAKEGEDSRKRMRRREGRSWGHRTGIATWASTGGSWMTVTRHPCSVRTLKCWEYQYASQTHRFYYMPSRAS